jgi:hypothetical protein
MGPTKPKSTVLSPAEEAVIVEFRRRTLLPLDDMMGCLRQKHSQTDPFESASLPAQAWHLAAASQRD